MSKKYNPSEKDAELIIDMYKNNISSNKIAEKFKVDGATIRKFLRRNYIEVSNDAVVKYARYGADTSITNVFNNIIIE